MKRQSPDVMLTIRRGAQKRLEALNEDGETIEWTNLGPGDQVIRIGLGFGAEFWRVDDDYEIDINNCRLDGGRLVLRNGEPVPDVDLGVLEAMVGKIETVRFRV